MYIWYVLYVTKKGMLSQTIANLFAWFMSLCSIFFLCSVHSTYIPFAMSKNDTGRLCWLSVSLISTIWKQVSQSAQFIVLIFCTTRIWHSKMKLFSCGTEDQYNDLIFCTTRIWHSKMKLFSLQLHKLIQQKVHVLCLYHLTIS